MDKPGTAGQGSPVIAGSPWAKPVPPDVLFIAFSRARVSAAALRTVRADKFPL